MKLKLLLRLAALSLLSPSLVVAQTPISALPALSSASPGTLVPVVDTATSPGVTKVVTVAGLTGGLSVTSATPNTLVGRDSSGNAAVNVLMAASVTGLSTPVNPSDAANKAYVDAASLGLTILNPAVAATTGTNISLSGGAPNALDGVTLALNVRILVKDQTLGQQNGTYYVSTLGTGSNGTWTRTADTIATNDYIFITRGTVNSNAAFIMVTPGPIIIGTTVITWSLFSQTTQILASNIIGQLVGSQIANYALTYTQFASSIQPVGIVSTLPSPSGYSGPSVLFDTTDGNLYRLVSGAWTLAVPASSITGTITSTQIGANSVTTGAIAANAITATQLAAGSVTSGAIAANSITTGMIQAGAITTSQIAAGAITTSTIGAGQVVASNIASLTITAAQIQTGTITADKLNVSALSAITANIGTITAGTISASATVDIGSGLNEFKVLTTGISMGSVFQMSATAPYGQSSPTVTAIWGQAGQSSIQVNSSLSGYYPATITGLNSSGTPEFQIFADSGEAKFWGTIFGTNGSTTTWSIDPSSGAISGASLSVSGAVSAGSISASSGSIGNLTVTGTFTLSGGLGNINTGSITMSGPLKLNNSFQSNGGLVPTGYVTVQDSNGYSMELLVDF